jgi:hypothetical protein
VPSLGAWPASHARAKRCRSAAVNDCAGASASLKSVPCPLCRVTPLPTAIRLVAEFRSSATRDLLRCRPPGDGASLGFP